MHKRQSLKCGFVIFLLFFAAVAVNLNAQSSFSVLSGWREWSDPANMLANCLNRQAFSMLEQRTQKIAQLRTADDWRMRQAEVRRILYDLVGPFPERTPLNPRVTGVLKKSGYRVEKIVFESQPGFFVTGALFIPENISGKTPAILNPIGHWEEGFRTPVCQELILNLVHKGFIVLAYDPVGQGERLQYFNAKRRKSDVAGSTAEHSHVGIQNFLVGSCFARYRIWDGMRGIDYLLSRPEVDPDRIGVTGISGGGTLSAYLGAFDDRIYAAAPTCYITGFYRLLSSSGPQDAEQNFPAGIASGIDHADLLEVRAPKPTLVAATTRDFFSIQGVYETAAEVERAFEAFGQQDNFSVAEDDYVHGYTKKLREAICAFFQKALQLPGDPADKQYQLLTYEELQITATGQVSTSLNSKTVFSLNLNDAEKNLINLEARRRNLASHIEQIRETAKKISGYQDPGTTIPAVYRGRVQYDTYNLEYYALYGEEGMVIPLLIFVPKNKTAMPAIIYCSSMGKSADAASDGAMMWFVRQGYMVAAPDLSGTGETEDGRTIFNPFRALQLGRSIPGIQAGDIIRILRFLMKRDDVQKNNISAVAVADAGPALLHAAVFDERIFRVALINSLTSYRCIVLNKLYDYDYAMLIPRILTSYDIPDLAAAFAPKSLLLVNMADNTSFPARTVWVKKEMEIAQMAYRNNPDNLTIRLRDETNTHEDIYGKWLQQ